MVCSCLGGSLGPVGDAGNEDDAFSLARDVRTGSVGSVRRERRRRGHRFRICRHCSAGIRSCTRRSSSRSSRGGSSCDDAWPASSQLAMLPSDNAPPPRAWFSHLPSSPLPTPAARTRRCLSLPAPRFGNTAAAVDNAVTAAWISSISDDAVAGCRVSRCRGRGCDRIADADTLMRGVTWPAPDPPRQWVVMGAAPSVSAAVASSAASGLPADLVVTATASAVAAAAGTATTAATLAATSVAAAADVTASMDGASPAMAARPARNDAEQCSDYARDYECSGSPDDDHTILMPKELEDLFKYIAAAAASAPRVPVSPFDFVSMVGLAMSRLRSGAAAERVSRWLQAL